MTTERYPIALEISGPTAMWTRPDTGDAPVSYPAPPFSAAKAIFESIVWLKNAEVVPARVEICSPLVFHTYSTNYGGPLRKTDIMKSGSSYQLLATVLINVCCRLHANVQPDQVPDNRLSDNARRYLAQNGAHAYQEMFERRLRRGQCHTEYVVAGLSIGEVRQLATNVPPEREDHERCARLCSMSFTTSLRV